MSVIALFKDQLRVKYLKLRKESSRDFAEKRSRLIARRVLSLQEIANAKFVSAYLPVNNEVETKEIIDSLIFRDKRIFLPVSNLSGYFFAEFTSWQNLEPGPYGILQPKINPSNTSGIGFDSSNKTNTSEVGSPRRFTLKGSDSSEVRIDIAIIPGVAFDKKGTRLGYGKGVFDKLLIKSAATKIGLAYDFQVVDELPRDKHDLVMDLVVTEKRVILC